MNWTSIIVAAIGGFAVNLLNLAELANIPKDKRPDLTDFVYWIPFIVSPLLGGFIGYVYVASGYDVKPVLALHLGVSAPLILRTLASIIPRSIPPIKPGDQA